MKHIHEGIPVFKTYDQWPTATNGDIWLVNRTERGGTTILASAVLAGPGSCFVGKRVRVTVEVLDEEES